MLFPSNGSYNMRISILRGITVCPTVCPWLRSFSECRWTVLCAGAVLPGGGSPGSWVVDIYLSFYLKILKSCKIQRYKESTVKGYPPPCFCSSATLVTSWRL